MCLLSHTFTIVWRWKNIRFLVTLLVSLTLTIAFPSFFCYSRSTLTAWFNLETCSRYKYTNLIARETTLNIYQCSHHKSLSHQGKLHIKGNYSHIYKLSHYKSLSHQGKLHSKGNYSNIYKLSHHNSLSQQGKLL